MDLLGGGGGGGAFEGLNGGYELQSTGGGIGPNDLS